MLFFAFVLLALHTDEIFGIPACSNGTVVPSDGLWTEWETYGSGECQTSCGSCSTILQTRQCASKKVGVDCVGNDTRQHPCNTQTCVYPSQRTCCIPYVMMKINGTNQCGPLEKVTTMSCCKTGGFWTEWSAYAKTDDGASWVRTRGCIMNSTDCPCVGDDTQNIGASCPCADLEDLQDSSDFITGTAAGPAGRPFYSNSDACTMIQFFNRSTYLPYTFCKEENGANVVQIRLKNTDNSLSTYLSAPCNLTNYAWTTLTFTCDLQSRYWRFDVINREILGIGQIIHV